ncbi:PTS sugar transporter subunit IIA [Spirillospora sp. CA-294931]|uniref:PTS sugar transporter subunit IIA n=1 Tax=Spirillospora sp. CA-294931 TaxID=3240042 RepID=UPI003D911CF4
MILTDYLTRDLVLGDIAPASKAAAIAELTAALAASGLVTDQETFVRAVREREAEGTTGIGDGIAIPHGKTDAIARPAVAFARVPDGVGWDSLDGAPARLLFLIGVPESAAGDEHLRILALLSRRLIDAEYRNALLTAPTPDDLHRLFAQITT